MVRRRNPAAERPTASATRALAARQLPAVMLTICVTTAVGLAGEVPGASFHGVVIGAEGPISEATVRIQASDISTVTDSLGRFTLGATGCETAVLTAWAPGFFIGGGDEHRVADGDIEIVLDRHGTGDCREYEWVSAFAESGEEQSCENCHAGSGDSGHELPFDQWLKDAHAGSARNPRFLTMYLGTDVHGNRSPDTRYRSSRDYGETPIPHAVDQSYFGPGYKLDFPSTAGNCATCHAPMAAIRNPYGIDPSRLEGVDGEGIGCDFCHKVADVVLDPATGRPFDNRPGVLSYKLRRPEGEHQFFAGPFDDVAPGEDVYSSLQTQSQYCAPCHSAEFWGVEVYNSYGEWLDSPYALADSETTCQDCHMPSGKNDHFARVDEGGRYRAPETIFSHRMPGASDTTLLRGAVEMAVEAEFVDGDVKVSVAVVNARTGHHVPSGSPLRQMILVVRARDGSGAQLQQLDGPVLPDWCGLGEPEDGYLARLPGVAYARVLEQLWTGVSPTAAYWTQTRVVSDNRIPALDADTTDYAFEAPEGGSATIDALLLYRRAFIVLSDQKSWDTPDIEMARETVTVSAS